MADDLEELIALGNVPRPKRQGRPPRRGAQEGQQALVEAPGQQLGVPGAAQGAPPHHGLELELAAMQPGRRYAQRSWESCDKARTVKALKRSQAALEEETAKRAKTDAAAQLMAASFPHVARMCGLQIKAARMDENRARLVSQLAVSPLLRGAAPIRETQSRAADLLAHTCMSLQRECFSELFASGQHQLGDLPEERFKVHVVSWQFDETSQLMKSVTPAGFKNEHTGFGRTSEQVMMQNGILTTCVAQGDATEVLRQEPYLCRALVLQSQTADALLEALFRQLPFSPESSEGMRTLSSSCDALVISFVVDRAATNFRALTYIWRCLSDPAMPKSVLPFVEPCAAHGVALVKARGQLSSSIVGGGHTFSTLMRQGRFGVALRDTFVKLASSKLRVVRGPMPPEMRERSRRLLGLLFGELGGRVRRTQPNGQPLPRSFSDELEHLVSVVALGQGGVEELTHFCWVAEGSPEHELGAPVGSACCHDFEESVERTIVPVLNLMVHKPWDRSAQSRWTYVLTLLRKLCLGYLSFGLLPAALRDLKTHWGLSEGMAPMLERMIGADNGEYEHRSKLRLLRVVRAFCSSDSLFALGLEVTTLSTIDPLLYDILGDGEKERCNLARLVSERHSVVAASQEALWRLLQAWGPGAEAWCLLDGLGCDWDQEACKSEARAAVLRAASALVDYFAQRLSHPPYSLLKLTDDALDVGAKRAVAESFLLVPDHCLSLFCRRLRERCGNVHSLMSEGAHILSALNAGSAISIDPTERLHAQLRVEIRSTGRGKSLTPCANRVLCQQTRAEHQRRFGTDVARASLVLDREGNRTQIAPIADDPPPAPSGMRGGSARLSWQNHKLATLKRTRAADRPLSQEELSEFRLRCEEQWQAVTPEEKEQWQLVWRGEQAQRLARRQAPHGAIVDDNAGVPKAKPTNLWRSSTEASSTTLVPLESIVAEHQKADHSSRRSRARHDPALTVLDSAVGRRVSCSADMTALVGCFASRKSVCRHTVAADVAEKLNGLTSMLNAWVGKVGVDEVRNCKHLLLWRGIGHDDEGHERSANACTLVVDVKQRPKMQYLGRCSPKDVSQVVFDMPANLPMVMSLRGATSGLSKRFQSVDICTSDDFCHQLCSYGALSWSIAPLEWSWVDGAGNLLDMQVSAIGEVFETSSVRVRAPRVKHKDLDCVDLFGDVNPFADGLPLRGVLGEVAVPPPPQAPAQQDAKQDRDLEDINSESSSDFEGLPPDVVDDIREDLREELQIDLPELSAKPQVEANAAGSAAAGEDLLGGESDNEEVALRAIEASAPDALQAAPVDAPPTAEDAANAATVSPGGYISCPLGLWASQPSIARITSWPSSAPMQSRSVSARCYIHSGCTSPAKRRWAVSDKDLLLWVFSGRVEQGASPARRRELATEHKAKWRELFPAGGPAPASREAAPPSGSGAASSSAA